MSRTEFLPNWSSAPGDTIIDILSERNLSKLEFARQMGNSINVDELLEGRATITIAVARQLEQILGASIEFWMSRDFQFRQDVIRLQKSDQEWIEQLPLGDMIKFGWLTPAPHPTEEMKACLNFFNVSDIKAWKDTYGELLRRAAFRTSPTYDSQPASVVAWLRQGEIEAKKIGCKNWSAERFGNSLPFIRSLAKIKDPRRFVVELKKCCADSGVAVVIVRAPAGCRTSGATRFLSPNKAVMMLSFRHLTDDQFWFTFFHEAGHLLLHGEKGFFLEGEERLKTPEEDEANKFAESVLIPSEYKADLLRLRSDSKMIIKYAIKINLPPGIVVGQLQHLGIIGHNQLNSLKRHYQWDE